MSEPNPEVVEAVKKATRPGALTPEQNQRALDWLRTQWKTPACPFHGTTDWGVDETLAEVRVFTGGSLIIGGPVFPFLVVTCQTCGYTVFVNALKAGIVTQQAQEAQG